MESRKRVYIAGAISHEKTVLYYDNIRRMVQVAKQASMAGFSVFVPCLDFMLHLTMTEIESSEASHNDWYYGRSMPWLEVSDAVLVVKGWENSHGTKQEISRAVELHIPVFYDINNMISYFTHLEIVRNWLET